MLSWYPGGQLLGVAEFVDDHHVVHSLCADGRRGFKPYLDAGAVDVAIIDCLWNGAWEGMKIAAVRNSSDTPLPLWLSSRLLLTSLGPSALQFSVDLFNHQISTCSQLCDTYAVNCAAHNFGAHLGSAISAHVLASIPNFRVLEYQPEDVPWRDSLFSRTPKVPTRPLAHGQR